MHKISHILKFIFLHVAAAPLFVLGHQLPEALEILGDDFDLLHLFMFYEISEDLVCSEPSGDFIIHRELHFLNAGLINWSRVLNRPKNHEVRVQIVQLNIMGVNFRNLRCRAFIDLSWSQESHEGA